MNFPIELPTTTLCRAGLQTQPDARRCALPLKSEVLRPLPAAPLAPCKEVARHVSVASATIHAGQQRLLRALTPDWALRSWSVCGRKPWRDYVGTSPGFHLASTGGQARHRIDYHHVIWSLVRKPGAFAAYQYRDELFPDDHFSAGLRPTAHQWRPSGPISEYVRILHLAATTSESEVETASVLLLEAGDSPQL